MVYKTITTTTVSVIFFILVQTAGISWFLADLNSTVRRQTADINEIKIILKESQNNYNDFRRSYTFIETTVSSLTRRVEILEQKVESLELKAK